ncbi:MAG: hypothetical protein FWD11_04975 [Micrococcales bacterium]|nr:hypothetical protein [Micrococcales bacterium]
MTHLNNRAPLVSRAPVLPSQASARDRDIQDRWEANGGQFTAELGAVNAEIADTMRRLGTLQATVEALQGSHDRADSPVEVPVRPAAKSSTPLMNRLDKPSHRPLIAALAIMDGWTIQLQDAIEGRRPVSAALIQEILDEDSCPLTYRMRSYRAVASASGVVAEAAAAHSAHHRITAQVLVAIRDGRMDEARRTMDAEDGLAGSVRRMRKALFAWGDMLADSGQF